MKKLKQLTEKIKENIDLLIESETEKKSTLELTLLDMKNRIIIAKDLIATAIAEIERLKLAYKDAISTQDNLQRIVDSDTSNTANQKVDEAKLNLHRQMQRVNDLEKQIHLQETVVSELKDKLKSYHHQFKTASRRAASLSQQQKRAELQAEFYQLFAESDNPDDSHTFKQAEIVLKKTEAEVELWKERNQNIDERVEKSEKGTNVDEALAALKNEIFGSSQND